MLQYDSNCTSPTNWFNFAGTPYCVFQHEQFKAFKSIEALLSAMFEEESYEADFWEQSNVLSPWNIYWTDKANEGGSLDINNQVFGPHWTKYRGLHWGLFMVCDPEEPCDWEGHNCVGVQLMIGHAAAAATTVKSLGILLIVVVPLSPTPSKVNAYSWHL
jgi:hypothetical protein